MDEEFEGFEDFEEAGPEPVKLRIPVWVLALLAVIVVLEVISWISFPQTVRDYKIYKEAGNRVENSEASSALEELLEVAERHPDSIPIMIKLTELSMKTGYYDIAGYVIDTYLVGKSLEDEDYNTIDRHYIRLENYFNSVAAVTKVVEEAASQGLTGEEEHLSYLREQIEKLMYTEGQDDAYLNYNMAMLSPDSRTILDYLQTCYEIDPECLDVRAQLGVVYRRLGQLEEAGEILEEALQKDKRDSGALRASATLAMVEGDLQAGLRAAKDAYESSSDGRYVRETYLIALTVNGMQEEAQVIRNEIEQSGEVLEENTLQLLAGEISLRDYYIGE